MYACSIYLPTFFCFFCCCLSVFFSVVNFYCCIAVARVASEHFRCRSNRTLHLISTYVCTLLVRRRVRDFYIHIWFFAAAYCHCYFPLYQAIGIFRTHIFICKYIKVKKKSHTHTHPVSIFDVLILNHHSVCCHFVRLSFDIVKKLNKDVLFSRSTPLTLSSFSVPSCLLFFFVSHFEQYHFTN